MTHDMDGMYRRDAAVETVLSLRPDLLSTRETEVVPLAEISGRTLAADLVAESDRPPLSRATMDGFAFDATDEYPLRLRESGVFPEDTPPTLESGEAIRISTGAPLPEGANAVLKVEEATVKDGMLRGTAISPGTYTYERGSNLKAGEVLFQESERLSPKDALLFRDLGHETVTVHSPFSVGILATGTEFHEGRQPDLDSPMLAGLVRSWGHHPVYEGTVPDEYDTVTERIGALADEHDVVITTGGTSVGKKDHVINALTELGEVLFHRVAIRPGKPIAVARLDDHDAIALAIPGKPVGAHTITTLVARPLFVGETTLPTVPVRLARDIDIGAPGFEYVIPVALNDGEAMPLGHVDSALSVYERTYNPSVLSSSTRASRADGFFITEDAVSRGDIVDVVPYTAIE